MIWPIIKASMAAIAILAFFLLILKRSHMFQCQRLWLLIGLAVCVVLPFLTLTILPISVYEMTLIDIPYIKSEKTTKTMMVTEHTSSISWKFLINGMLVAGALVLLSHTTTALIKLAKIIQNSEKHQYMGISYYLTTKAIQPFCFGRQIIVPKHFETQEELAWILIHEYAHIQSLHFLDNLILHISKYFLWWHPLYWVFRKELRLIHELQADAFVLKKRPFPKQYSTFLLKCLGLKIPSSIEINTFFHSPIKFRIMKIHEKPSTIHPLNLFALIPIMGILVWACQDNVAEQWDEGSAVPIEKQEANSKVYKVVEEMPRFPGCEHIDQKEERKKCSDNEMLNYIYTNIVYPENEREAGTEGMVVATFIVEKDGSLSNIEVIRSPGTSFSLEVTRLIESMNEKGIKWTPGREGGHMVRTKFVIPIKFQLS